jgi:hypothetical protein
MKLTEYPKTPADLEWDRLRLDAEKFDLLLVRVSERKYQIGERRFIRTGFGEHETPRLAPYVLLEGAKYSWTKGLEALGERLEKKYAAKKV